MARPTVRTAVLPVAGLGTRFLPVTKTIPKEMLPIVDRPCIEYVVAEAVAAGMERIVFVTAEGKDAQIDYFRPSPGLEAYLEATGKASLLADIRRVGRMAEVIAVRQDEALGLGHAVLQARDVVGDEPFAVLLGDDIIDAEVPCISQLLEDFAPGLGVVALMQVPRSETDRYGVCAGPMVGPRMQIEEMVEKPTPADAPSQYAIVGRYVLPPEIWDLLAATGAGAGGEIQLTDALAALALQNRMVGRVFDGERFDTGNVVGLLRATLHFALKRPELRDSVQALLDEMRGR
jgi:UTP--glucose-1-phosphate uridylyltransferase